METMELHRGRLVDHIQLVAFLLDPDGNNIEAVFHGEADRSATSVKISFAAPAGSNF